MPSGKDVNPRNIWGKVVYYLKQNNYNALHVICGSINDVAIEDDNFVIRTYDDYIYQHIIEKVNQNVIMRGLTWQDVVLSLKIEKVEKVDKTQEDINKLKTLVGEYLKIIGENNESI